MPQNAHDLHAFLILPDFFRLVAVHHVPVTAADNRHTADHEIFVDDIKVGMAKTEGKYVEIPDRKEAIAYAIHHGEPGDIVVLAGKGHEDYQEIKGKKYPMDERVLIADILAGR